MINKLNLIIILLLIQLLGFSKSKTENLKLPNWVSESYRDSVYPASEFFVQYAKWEEVRSKNRIEKESQLIKTLKEKITNRIYTSVSSSSVLQRNETSQGEYSEIFSNETKVFSNIKLFDSKPHVFYDRKNRVLYGMLTVNKQNLGNKYIKSLRNKLLVFNNELSAYNTNINARTLQEDISSFENRIDKLEQQFQVIIATGVKSPNDFAQLFSNVRSEINSLHKTLYSAENEELIQQAQHFLLYGDYTGALKSFKLAEIKLPHDDRIVNGIKESEKQIEKQYLNLANNYVNKEQFNLALNQYELLFNLLPETRERYIKEYNKLTELSFNLFAEELDYALKNRTIPEIEKALKNLQKYQHVNRDKYNKYHNKVSRAIADDLHQQAKIKYNDGSYNSAITIINRAITIDNNNSSYSDLKEKAQHKLYKNDLKDLKKTRPFLYALQWGIGVQTQNSLLSTYKQTDKWSFQLIPSASVGLYRKFGITENIWPSGRDKSHTSMIGLRYTHQFQQIYYNSENEFVKTDMIGLNEFEVVLGLKTTYLFNMGVTAYNIKTDLMKNKIDMISASLIRRFYMHPVELQFEFKTYIDADMNFYPLLKLSLLINSNFIRQVNRSDKTKIKYDIEN